MNPVLPPQIMVLLDSPIQEGPIPEEFAEEEILYWIESGIVEVSEPLFYGAVPRWGLTIRGEQVAKAQKLEVS